MVENLLEALGVSAAHVLAHDVGDTVAQELLARHNARQAAAGMTGGEACYLCCMRSMQHASCLSACQGALERPTPGCTADRVASVMGNRRARLSLCAAA